MEEKRPSSNNTSKRGKNQATLITFNSYNSLQISLTFNANELAKSNLTIFDHFQRIRPRPGFEEFTLPVL